MKFAAIVLGLFLLFSQASETSSAQAVKLSHHEIDVDSLIHHYSTSSPETAIAYAKLGLSKATDKNNVPVIAQYCVTIAKLYTALSLNDSAKYFLLNALRLYKVLGDEAAIAETQHLVGDTFFNSGELQEAESSYQQAYDTFKSLHKISEMLLCLESLGLTYKLQGQFEKVIEKYQEGIIVAEHYSLPKEKAKFLGLIGYLNNDFGNYSVSLVSFSQALEIYKTLHDSLQIARTYNDMGFSFRKEKRVQDAIKSHTIALQIYQLFNVKGGTSRTLEFLGFCYSEMNQYTIALEKYNEALKLKIEIQEQNAIPYSYAYIGDAYLHLHKYSQAIRYYKQALSANREYITKYALCDFTNALGVAYGKMKQYELANKYIQQSLAIAKEVNLPTMQLKNLGILSSNYKALGNLQSALHYMEKFTSLKDSVFNKEAQKNTATLLAKLENENKERRIALLTKEKELRETYLLMSILGSIFLLVMIMVIYISYKHNKKSAALLKRQKEELTELNTTKDKFFSIIAHDLKSPFTTLIGISEMIAAEQHHASKEELLHYYAALNDEIHKVYSLTEDLLEWGRLQRNAVKFERVKLNLSEDIFDTIAVLSGSAQKKNISITTLFPEHLDVFYDQKMITTVVRNLISNAIKFTQKGGTITVKAAIENSHALVQVCDDGVGISQEDLSKLFRIDLYYSTTGTNSETGTGLGLILCKEFIEKHNGTIWAESEVGKGSVFSFTLSTALEQ